MITTASHRTMCRPRTDRSRAEVVRPGRLLAIATLLLTLSVCNPIATAKPQIVVVRGPVFIDVRLGDDAALIGRESDAYEALVTRLADAAAAQAVPNRLLVLKLDDLPLDSNDVTSEMRSLLGGPTDDWHRWYENAVGTLLRDLICAVRDQHTVPVTVAGLLEASANKRYLDTMDQLDALISVRSFVLSASSDELTLVQRAFPAALALAGDRPIYYRANRTWRAVMNGGGLTNALAMLAIEDLLPEHLASFGGGSSATQSSGPPLNNATAEAGLPGIGDTGYSMGAGGASPVGGAGGSAAGDGGGGGGGDGGGGGGGGAVAATAADAFAESGGGAPAAIQSGGSGGGGGGGSVNNSDEDDTTSDEDDTTTSSSTPINIDNFPAVVVNQTLTAAMQPLVEQNGLQDGIIIYQWCGDPERTGQIDLDLLQYWIEYYVPQNFDGFASLDFEHPYFPNLNMGPSAPEFHDSQQQLVLAMRHAKAIRPNAKWGHWGLPRIRYGQYSDADIALVTAPDELLAEVEWMAPSIYDKHPDNDAPNRPEREELFVKTVVEISREIAGDRPVLPYVWHRYARPWEITVPPSLELVPDSELIDFPRWALQAGADGFVWWGNDDFYLRLLETPPTENDRPSTMATWIRIQEVLADEQPAGMTLEEWIDSLHGHVLGIYGDIAADHATSLADGVSNTP